MMLYSLYRADLCDHGVCVQGQAAGVPQKESGGALLWQPSRLQPETDLPRPHLLLLSGSKKNNH